MSTDNRSIKWYNRHAADYAKHVRDETDSIYHSLYEKPAMYSLVPDLDGKTVISLGCGSGEDCEYLKRHGAGKVVGIDISENIIKIANSTYPDCDFMVMDMENLDFSDESFDFAYSSLAIHYIEDWHRAFKEVYRILKPGKNFLFSCEHPVASSMAITQNDENVKIQQLSRKRDKKSGKIEIIGDYLTRRTSGINIDWPVTIWHKSISEIVSEATDAGFLIVGICEPKPLEKMNEISPKAYQTLNKIPHFIIFKLLKP